MRRSVADIQSSIAAAYGLTRAELLSPDKARRLINPRHVAMYVARAATGHSYPLLARLFHRADHTTILHAIWRVERLRAQDAEIDALIVRELA